MSQPLLLALGALKSTSPNRFIGKFVLDNSEYLISGSFTHNLPKFVSTKAWMLVENKNALSGVRLLEGSVGCDKVSLKIGNTGNIIEAELDEPMCPGHSVTGTGMFTEV